MASLHDLEPGQARPAGGSLIAAGRADSPPTQRLAVAAALARHAGRLLGLAQAGCSEAQVQVLQQQQDLAVLADGQRALLPLADKLDDTALSLLVLALNATDSGLAEPSGTAVLAAGVRHLAQLSSDQLRPLRLQARQLFNTTDDARRAGQRCTQALMQTQATLAQVAELLAVLAHTCAAASAEARPPAPLPAAG